MKKRLNLFFLAIICFVLLSQTVYSDQSVQNDNGYLSYFPQRTKVFLNFDMSKAVIPDSLNKKIINFMNTDIYKKIKSYFEIANDNDIITAFYKSFYNECSIGLTLINDSPYKQNELYAVKKAKTNLSVCESNLKGISYKTDQFIKKTKKLPGNIDDILSVYKFPDNGKYIYKPMDDGINYEVYCSENAHIACGVINNHPLYSSRENIVERYDSIRSVQETNDDTNVLFQMHVKDQDVCNLFIYDIKNKYFSNIKKTYSENYKNIPISSFTVDGPFYCMNNGMFLFSDSLFLIRESIDLCLSGSPGIKDQSKFRDFYFNLPEGAFASIYVDVQGLVLNDDSWKNKLSNESVSDAINDISVFQGFMLSQKNGFSGQLSAVMKSSVNSAIVRSILKPGKSMMDLEAFKVIAKDTFFIWDFDLKKIFDIAMEVVNQDTNTKIFVNEIVKSVKDKMDIDLLNDTFNIITGECAAGTNDTSIFADAGSSNIPNIFNGGKFFIVMGIKDKNRFISVLNKLKGIMPNDNLTITGSTNGTYLISAMNFNGVLTDKYFVIAGSNYLDSFKAKLNSGNIQADSISVGSGYQNYQVFESGYPLLVQYINMPVLINAVESYLPNIQNNDTITNESNILSKDILYIYKAVNELWVSLFSTGNSVGINFYMSF